MINVSFAAFFSRAWLTPERIETIAGALAGTWGPDRYGTDTPNRAFAVAGLCKLLAKCDVYFERGKPSFTEPRTAGSILHGKPLPFQDELGAMSAYVQASTAEERETIHRLYLWLASLPECTLASHLEFRGPMQPAWEDYAARSENPKFQRSGLPLPAADTFYGARLIRHLPDGCLPTECHPFGHGQRLVLVDRDLPLPDLATLVTRVERAARPLQDAGVCGIPSPDGLDWDPGPNWTPLPFESELDPASPTPPLSLDVAPPKAPKRDPAGARRLADSIERTWHQALLDDADDATLEALAFRLVEELEQVRDLDPSNLEAARHQIELLLGPIGDRSRGMALLDALREERGMADFVASVEDGECPAPFSRGR